MASLEASPFSMVTFNGPDFDFFGTTAITCVALAPITLRDSPFRVTEILERSEEKLLPVMSISVPPPPFLGMKSEMVMGDEGL
ncbi:hypothetical protein D3C86_2014240 [compost metagenome]